MQMRLLVAALQGRLRRTRNQVKQGVAANATSSELREANALRMEQRCIENQHVASRGVFLLCSVHALLARQTA